jgi:anti-sigma factor RsiW
MTQACAMWRGDIGAYIVGALDGEASARVRRHLRACRACRDDYHALVPVRDWLGWLVLAGEPDTGDRPGRPPLEPVRSLRGHVPGGCAGAGCPRPLRPRRPPVALPSPSRRCRLIRPRPPSAPSTGPPACTGRPA